MTDIGVIDEEALDVDPQPQSERHNPRLREHADTNGEVPNRIVLHPGVELAREIEIARYKDDVGDPR